jgi:hypothetical protein
MNWQHLPFNDAPLETHQKHTLPATQFPFSNERKSVAEKNQKRNG